MATHRADVDMSAQYKPMEDVFIQIGKGQKDDPVYKMNSAEKDCLDTFMMARNNDLVWGKTDVDVNGKPKIYEPETGRPHQGVVYWWQYIKIFRIVGKSIIWTINIQDLF